MVRLKFAIFAVAVLLLWLWHLYSLAPSLGDGAKAAASIQAARAPAGVAVKIDERRREFHRAALKVASAPGVLFALRNRAEPPTADKFAPIKAAVLEGIPDSYRAALVVGLSNEHGAIYARGPGEPVTDPKDLNVSALAQAGAEGQWQEAFGSTYLFFSFPVAVYDRGEPKLLGDLVLGAPLQVENILDGAAREAGLGAIALLQGGKVIAIAGPQKPPADKMDHGLGPGKTDVVVRGEVMSLAFFHFPIGTNGDTFGGSAPLWIGSRQGIRATPYEVIGYAATLSVMEPLARYQRVSLWLLFALLGLSLAFGLLIETKSYRLPIRRAQHEGRPGVLPQRGLPLRDRAQRPSARTAAPASSLAEEPPPVPESAADGLASSAAFHPHPSYPRLRADDSFAADPHAAESRSKPDGFGAAEENQPPPLLPDDAFSLASGQSEERTAPADAPETYPDATRVQEIPEELLRASARPEREPEPLPEPSPKSIAVEHGSVPNDEQHFRDVFQEFVATREKCGEPADGLTYDRFAQKLRKNRDQLIEKYNCRTVRFQVYVKGGKAALKAAPIKA
jgi:hypothetical protein